MSSRTYFDGKRQPTMKSFILKLPEDMKTALNKKAKKEMKTRSAIIRDAIYVYLFPKPKSRSKPKVKPQANLVLSNRDDGDTFAIEIPRLTLTAVQCIAYSFGDLGVIGFVRDAIDLHVGAFKEGPNITSRNKRRALILQQLDYHRAMIAKCQSLLEQDD